MRFWLDMGVDGFRLDAIPYLVEREGTNNENLRETHDVIKQLRAAIDADYKNRFLLAEANQWPETSGSISATATNATWRTTFRSCRASTWRSRQEDRYAHHRHHGNRHRPFPENCQWGLFLRNHDELTLEMVTGMTSATTCISRTYGSDVRACASTSAFVAGVCRRLMDNNRRPHRAAELPFAELSRHRPRMYYGDEIGMGDNIYLR